MYRKALVNSAGLLILATAAAGCGSIGRDPITVGSVPEDYRTRHPIVLSEQERTLDVPIASGARELNIPVKSNIRAFAANFAASGTGTLIVMQPVGSANEQAVKRVQGDILQALADGGAPRSRIAVQHYDASAHGSAAAVRLSYAGVTASTTPCGNWPDDLTETVENRNYADFGCSSQQNLAAIVANPGDLLGPRQSSPIDATQRGTVIEDYQSGTNGAASEVRY
ncbi:CpaD family pilus assembly lipoprotein [Oricola sp.]|uniref:CpaD family pilus assembly protein n=1 Tax=Oricola sp. TaxID=1979950 RepID=UPI0025E460E0|nr:CpaD family pilus assembly lipoprotein [Oricola sp.]MCI5078035.1 CpaD family pilus assembly lipoprotein [Oricola sp.]